MLKRCKKCDKEKKLEDFPKNKKMKDGCINTCKVCRKNHYSKYYKEYAIINKEKLNDNKNKFKINNPDKIKKAQKDYIEKNKENRKLWYNQHRNNRRKNDPLFKLKDNIRCIIGCSIRTRGYNKKSKTYEILGCSYEDFMIYIEAQFDTWMNWDNHGKYTGNYNETWQYDHIIPISIGMSEDEIIKLNHYTNFRPLCSKLNLEKSNKIIIN
jgi:hypothetical protein